VKLGWPSPFTASSREPPGVPLFHFNMPILILAFLLDRPSQPIVLGILYESLIHPITILSTRRRRGGGACCADDLPHPASVIAFIGISLLIGIVRRTRS